MGLLNHIFGNRESAAKELLMDNEKRMVLWKQHLANYSKKDELAHHFSFGNIDKAMHDFNATERVLNQIEELIPPELVNINNEEKLDHEILSDLGKLKSSEEYFNLAKSIVEEMRKQEKLIALFEEIYFILKTELHLLKLIKKRPANTRELLLQLFRVISVKEGVLYKVFREDDYTKFYEHNHRIIGELAKSIILQEELKKELEIDEEKFVKKMIKSMRPAESETQGRYRELGEKIFQELTGISDALPSKVKDIAKIIEMAEKRMQNDAIMHLIIKKLRPRYDDAKIKATMQAFRGAYDLGHFENLETEFFT